jgi:hypothetical protein
LKEIDLTTKRKNKMRSIIDKVSLGKVIAKNMTIYEQHELWLEWVNRESTEMADVLKYATDEDVKEAQKQYNEIP